MLRSCKKLLATPFAELNIIVAQEIHPQITQITQIKKRRKQASIVPVISCDFVDRGRFGCRKAALRNLCEIGRPSPVFFGAGFLSKKN
jgi:hypothetical protein